MPARTLLGLTLGKRLPTVDGDLAVPGLRDRVTVRRDKFGVPHIAAETDADAWFALGFCQGQDRAFQLETNLRVGRGTLAELVGPPGLGIDRLSRRIGFHRSAVEQTAVISALARDTLTAFCHGINAAFTHGLPKKPHELAVLGGELTPWTPADVLAFLKLTSFLLPGNWDVELARLRVLSTDGPEALRALDPTFQAVPGERLLGAAGVVEALVADIAAFQKARPTGGGSNNFVIRGDRTLSGLPLLASDPHLAPVVPAPWYLAHVRTPTWSVAGATFAGTPTFAIGHNEVACWGITAGLTDNTDLWLEPLGPDGQPEGVRRREVIVVKGAADHVEEVIVTPRGPVISPLLDGATVAISLQAVWLLPLPVDGFLSAQLATNFEDFRRPFAHWPGLPQNVLYADRTGVTGYQLVGQLPKRRGSTGLIPMRPADASWEADLVPFDAMPHLVNVPYFATANAAPPEGDVWLGADFIEHYRTTVLTEELSARSVGWTVEDCRALQKNVRSKPWEQLRGLVLSLATGDGDLNEALALLRAWDGHLRATSAAATLFTLLLHDLTIQHARQVAPNSWPAMLGGDGEPPLGHNLFADRTTGPTVARLLATEPREAMRQALADTVRMLKAKSGPSADWWQWGDLRPLHVTHALFGKHWLLGRAFNLPVVPVGGDANTVSQAGVRPLAPLEPTHNFPNLRMVFDPSDWNETRIDLCGGQSGNPLSPHYDDLFHLRERGEAAKLPWDPEQVLKATTSTLRLSPVASPRS